VAVNCLIDTNVFLEILLGQPNKERCKQVLQDNSGAGSISDFSLHSIGVIAFRGRREAAYSAFLRDMLPGLAVLHLDKRGYAAVLDAHQRLGLDFDDAGQFALAEIHDLTLVTQDGDFRRATSEISVRFL
jgi:predicted nucleic acid-binding protein